MVARKEAIPFESQPVRAAVKPSRLLLLLLTLPLTLSSVALATPAKSSPSAKKYALAYTWHQELQQALENRNKLSRVLPAPANRQLLVVGKKGEYGVVYPLRGTLAQARQTAIKQSHTLALAGFTPADILPEGSYSPLNKQQLAQGRESKTTAPTTAKPCRLAEGSAKATKSQASSINSKIQDFLSEQRSKGRLRQREMAALVAYDLSSNTYVASVNAQRSFQAASMIKPFVALAFFDQVQRGKLKYSPTHRQMMEEMIQHSDNEATNWFIRQVGGPARCNAVINGQYGKLFSKVRIVEYIPPGGRTYKNSALPQDYVQFLRALWNNQLPHSQEMLRVMSLPGRDRIFSGTEVPPGTLVYNKTGTTSLLCGDMGILVTRSKNGLRVPYAVVGIVERPTLAKDYKQWMASGGGVIRDFSSLVYEEMKQKYNLM